MRALVAKFGSAIQRLLIFLTLFLSGLYGVSQTISNGEAQLHAGLISEAELTNDINAARDAIDRGQWMIFSAGMLWIPLILLVVSLILCRFVFKIDEKRYQEIVDELQARRQGKENVQQ